jgi:hypothetical protein
MYNDNKGFSQPPGYGPESESEDRGILLSGSPRDFKSIWIDKDTEDNENVGKVTRLRPGLVLVPNVARTFHVNPEHADAMAAEDLLPGDPVVLTEYRETKDGSDTVQHITAKALIMGSVISERLLFGDGTSDPDIALIKAAMPRVSIVAGHEPL